MADDDDWFEPEPSPLTIVVHSFDNLINTGLLDANGAPIYRRRPIGFGREEEFVVFGDEAEDVDENEEGEEPEEEE